MNVFVHTLLKHKDYSHLTKLKLINYCRNIINLINNIVFTHKKLDLQLLYLLDDSFKTSLEDKDNFAEVSTPIPLLSKITKYTKENIDDKQTSFDYSCGKGNIVLIMFLQYYNFIIDKQQIVDSDIINYYSYSVRYKICKLICEKLIYYADINPLNVFITTYKLKAICSLLCKYDNFDFNFKIGDSFKIDLSDWNCKVFDNVFVNPPFEDKNKRNTTPHKLWLDFTIKTFKEWLKKDGHLIQISPASFSSPSSKLINLIREKNIKQLHFNQDKYFKNISISIAWYIIQNNNDLSETNVNDKYSLLIDENIIYIPNDCNSLSLPIHKKVMFDTKKKLKIERDYVTCHNIRIKDKNPTLSKIKTETHIYPVFHTNKQIWYSSIKQNFSHCKKVMWTRSGYTKPFYDNGEYGVTDLGYFIKVSSKKKGEILNHNLNLQLFKYIFKTARWSGFGNDKVFDALPLIPYIKYTDDELFNLFHLTASEKQYIKDAL